jgi:hypothetical protein
MVNIFFDKKKDKQGNNAAIQKRNTGKSVAYSTDCFKARANFPFCFAGNKFQLKTLHT